MNIDKEYIQQVDNKYLEWAIHALEEARKGTLKVTYRDLAIHEAAGGVLEQIRRRQFVEDNRSKE